MASRASSTFPSCRARNAFLNSSPYPSNSSACSSDHEPDSARKTSSSDVAPSSGCDARVSSSVSASAFLFTSVLIASPSAISIVARHSSTAASMSPSRRWRSTSASCLLTSALWQSSIRRRTAARSSSGASASRSSRRW
jgi:hypothetical protein